MMADEKTAGLASVEGLPGLSPDETLSYWAWLHSTAFDREWEAYRAGQGGGAEFRRLLVDPAWSLRMIGNTVLKHTPELLLDDDDEGRFVRLSRGLSRRASVELSHQLRRLAAYWGSLPSEDEENEANQVALGLAVTRFHEVLGIAAREMNRCVPASAEDEPPLLVAPVPWERRRTAKDMGHGPTVRVWAWLTSVSNRIEARVCGRGKRDLPFAERQLGRWKVRALRLAMADLWRMLPPRKWRPREDSTWDGLCRGLRDSDAAVLKQRLRQRARDRRAQGEHVDVVLAELYDCAAAQMRAAFGFDLQEQLRMRPTGPGSPPESLEWSGWLCVPGMMIWETDVPLTRENFIQRIERG
jgi:hypothetical protein